jgi:hypothetical protein
VVLALVVWREKQAMTHRLVLWAGRRQQRYQQLRWAWTERFRLAQVQRLQAQGLQELAQKVEALEAALQKVQERALELDLRLAAGTGQVLSHLPEEAVAHLQQVRGDH